MSTATDERIPRLTLGWRMQMSLGRAGMGRKEVAAILGVTPATITRWTHDVGAPPKRAYLLQWAELTDVPVEWLEHGIEGPSGPTPAPGGDVSARVRRLAESKRLTRPYVGVESVTVPALEAA